VLYWHKGGRKGTTTEKNEGIYKKNPGIRLVVLFFSFFFSFLLLTTHNYSEILTYQERCALVAQRVKEKRLSFSSLLFFILYTRARVHTHSSDKDLVFYGEFFKKIRAS
jgi:hypothetical protein